MEESENLFFVVIGSSNVGKSWLLNRMMFKINQEKISNDKDLIFNEVEIPDEVKEYFLEESKEQSNGSYSNFIQEIETIKLNQTTYHLIDTHGLGEKKIPYHQEVEEILNEVHHILKNVESKKLLIIFMETIATEYTNEINMKLDYFTEKELEFMCLFLNNNENFKTEKVNKEFETYVNDESSFSLKERVFLNISQLFLCAEQLIYKENCLERTTKQKNIFLFSQNQEFLDKITKENYNIEIGIELKFITFEDVSKIFKNEKEIFIEYIIMDCSDREMNILEPEKYMGFIQEKEQLLFYINGYSISEKYKFQEKLKDSGFSFDEGQFEHEVDLDKICRNLKLSKQGMMFDQQISNEIISELSKNDECFSLDMSVETLNEGLKKLKNVKATDKVVDITGGFEDICAIIHWSEKTETEFLLITTEGKNVLEVTKNHLLLAEKNGKQDFMEANMLKLGDFLFLKASEEAPLQESRIKNIETITKLGYSAPLTSSGVLCVNNFVCSCYSYTNHKIAHLAVKPYIYYCQIKNKLCPLQKIENENELSYYFRILEELESKFLKM